MHNKYDSYREIAKARPERSLTNELSTMPARKNSPDADSTYILPHTIRRTLTTVFLRNPRLTNHFSDSQHLAC